MAVGRMAVYEAKLVNSVLMSKWRHGKTIAGFERLIICGLCRRAASDAGIPRGAAGGECLHKKCVQLQIKIIQDAAVG